MEPMSLIFSAIVAGATAVLKPTAEQAVKDAYDELKAIIKKKWSRVEVESLERDPADEARQALVKSDLRKAGDIADRDVLELARQVLAVVGRHDPAAAKSAGITIEHLKAGADINIDSLMAEGAITARQLQAEKGSITIRSLDAGKAQR